MILMKKMKNYIFSQKFLIKKFPIKSFMNLINISEKNIILIIKISLQKIFILIYIWKMAELMKKSFWMYCILSNNGNSMYAKIFKLLEYWPYFKFLTLSWNIFKISKKNKLFFFAHIPEHCLGIFFSDIYIYNI